MQGLYNFQFSIFNLQSRHNKSVKSENCKLKITHLSMSTSFTHSLAFVFNSDLSEVILIEKQRPQWQKGLWNGLGGKIEPGESIQECLIREVKEESGLSIPLKSWVEIASMTAQDWNVLIFGASIPKSSTPLHSATGEVVKWFSLKNFPQVIDNLYWLIPLSMNKLQNQDLLKVAIHYNSKNRNK